MALSDWIAEAESLLGRAWDWLTGLFGPSPSLLPSPGGDQAPSPLDQAPSPSVPNVTIIPKSTEDQQPVATIDGTSIFRTGNVLWWRDGDLSIDYDGAPNAYAPPGVGQPLDKLANARDSSGWVSIETNDGKPTGQPVVQGPNDPYPGYYISTTALGWPGQTGTAHYVDATTISYVSLPPVFIKQLGAKKGDLVYVESSQAGTARWAIFADIGPAAKLGEGSVYLAQALGVEAAALRSAGINMAVYCGSGDGKPHTEDEIQSMGQALVQAQGVA